MNFWIHNLLNRAQSLEDKATNLCNQVNFLRRRLQGSFMSLQDMIDNADSTQMRARAIHHIRTKGPALPPALEKKKVIKKGLAEQDVKTETMAWASRFLG